MSQDEGSKRPEIKLNVPETLKVLLVDDWEAVTKNQQVGAASPFEVACATFWCGQLVTLPRSPTVIDVLEEFKGYVLETKPAG